jgi:WD40 repeat protein
VERFVAVDWSSTGRLAVSTDDNSFDVWDANRGMLGPFIDEEMAYVGDVAWSPDGTLLATIATAGATGQVRLWDMSEMPPTPLDTRVMEVNPNAQSLSFSPMGTRVAGGNAGIGVGSRERVFIWDTLSGVELRAMEASNGYGSVQRTAWSPGGLYLAAVLHDDMQRKGTVEVFDVRSGEIVAALHDLSGAPNVAVDAVWSPDGSLLAIAARPEGILIWQIDDNRLERLSGPGGSVLAVAWGPTEGGNSSLLAASTSGGAVFLWQWDLR